MKCEANRTFSSEGGYVTGRPSVTLLQGNPQMSLVCLPCSGPLDVSRCWTKVISEVTYSEYLSITEYERENEPARSSEWTLNRAIWELFWVFPDNLSSFKKANGAQCWWVGSRGGQFVYPDDRGANWPFLENSLAKCSKDFKNTYYFKPVFSPPFWQKSLKCRQSVMKNGIHY